LGRILPHGNLIQNIAVAGYVKVFKKWDIDIQQFFGFYLLQAAAIHTPLAVQTVGRYRVEQLPYGLYTAENVNIFKPPDFQSTAPKTLDNACLSGV